MLPRIITPLLFGLAGFGVLLWLGSWQVQRLSWKNAILADIEARIAMAPVAVPDVPEPSRDRYLPVTAVGTADDGVQVFSSLKGFGAGYRMLSVFTIDTAGGGTRRLLLDRGFRPVDSHTDFNGPVAISVTGNLHWPDEVDGFTPAPEGTTFYARDIAAISAQLNTEPVLIVAREITPPLFSTQAVPIRTSGIPNDHLGYAITWFSLAFVWLVMTAVLLWRIRQRPARNPKTSRSGSDTI